MDNILSLILWGIGLGIPLIIRSPQWSEYKLKHEAAASGYTKATLWTEINKIVGRWGIMTPEERVEAQKLIDYYQRIWPYLN